MLKRVFLFVLTNLLVMLTISVVLSVLGVRPYLTQAGIDYQSLMIFCAVWGMGGAFISLALSKVMAKWAMGVKIIDPNTSDPEGRALVQMVHRLATGAHLPGMPDVGIYDSPEINAFATGPTRGSALVAVSTGLIRSMGRAEVEGVLSHEIAHVANGDMVTMTLIQGVVNAFVMFLARILAFVVGNLMRGENDNRGPSFFARHLLVWVFDILFGILGSMVVCWFSRYREYRADQGGATLAGREKMISALEALRRGVEGSVGTKPAYQALMISNPRPTGLMSLLMTHPPLEARIERLRRMA